MSLSLVIQSEKLPSFAEMVAAAALRWPIQMHAVDGEENGWPVGTLHKVPDASNRPFSLGMSPELTKSYELAGLSPTFLAYVPERACRGVEIARNKDHVRFRVTQLASAEDYELGVRLAAALSRITGVAVSGAHGPDGVPMAPLSESELLLRFDSAFVEQSARDMARQLLAEATVKTVWLFGPQGWRPIGPEQMAGLYESDRFERARELLRAPKP